MKIIISHDVDHLYPSDHFFKDLILEKLFVRSLIQLSKKQITKKECRLRCFVAFKKQMNNIIETAKFDQQNNVPSTFFFGMTNCLGMSYKKEKTLPYIKWLIRQGFNCGVHGCDYQSLEGICKERSAFKALTQQEAKGIRMHYVRYNTTTFANLSQAGYSYDSSEFDKARGYLIKAPYKVGNMWEFPLIIMDGYLPHKFNEAKQCTIDILELCRQQNIKYICILFHDYQYCEAYSEIKKWYQWLIKYINANDNDCFISYTDAIAELEATTK